MKIYFLILAMIFNLNQHLNPNHTDLFQSTDFELAVRGGANAGKTYSISDKMLLQPVWQPEKRLKALILRKTLPALKNSVLDIMERRAELFKLPFRINKNENIGQCLNMQYVFLSLNNKEDYYKIKSITDVDFVWVNEVNEIRETDYELLKTRIRGGQSSFKQFVTDFNPVGKTSWVFTRFYQKNIGNVRKLCYTIFDNPWASKDEIKNLKATKKHNPNFFKVYFKGEWGDLEGLIYSNWDIVPESPKNPDEIIYGGDFGYSVNPAAYIRIYRKADEFWVEEVLYQTGLTNPKLAEKIKSLGADDAVSYWDSSEPKSIDELCDHGINAKPASKGPDSVRAGIDFLQSKKIHIIDGSENIIKEQKSYMNKQDKDGNYLPEPMKFNDHTMDGIRYGIFTHCKDRIEPRIWRA